MTPAPAPWNLPPFAFGLIPGPREVVLVLLVVLALYGRAGSRLLWATPYGRRLAPWLSVVRNTRAVPRGPTRTSPAPTKPRRRGLLFWVLTLTAAGAALAWIATRLAIQSAGTLH